MPRIFDTIEQNLLPALKETPDASYRADFCMGYFNLRGWRQIDACVQEWTAGWGCSRHLGGLPLAVNKSLREVWRLVTDFALGQILKRRFTEGLDE